MASLHLTAAYISSPWPPLSLEVKTRLDLTKTRVLVQIDDLQVPVAAVQRPRFQTFLQLLC